MDKYIKILIIVLLVILFLGVGYYFVGLRSSEESSSMTETNNVAITQDIQETAEEVTNMSNYVDFNQQEYEASLAEGKVVLLYFTANWCPTCRQQELVNADLFQRLESDEEVIVYKVHILDDETTEQGEALATEYGVRLQHSFVLIGSGGEVVFTHTGPLTESDLETELMQAKNGSQ